MKVLNGSIIQMVESLAEKKGKNRSNKLEECPKA